MLSIILSSPIYLGLMLLVGLVLLVKGADWLVDGASFFASNIGVSDLIIGLTIVAFGTSMPEFVVNMFSVADGATDLAITNILGSNIINTLVILGCAALVYPISVQRVTLLFDLPMNILAGVATLVFILITMPTEAHNGLSRTEGVILLLLFVAFLLYSFRSAKDNTTKTDDTTIVLWPVWKCLIFILIGLVCLVAGGEIIVKSATALAARMGIAESVIGLTIVALGTSLPELATSVMAAFKHNSDIAIGNVVGSNIFNVFFILATSAVIKPLPSYNGIVLDAFMTAGSALAVLFIVLANSLIIWGKTKDNKIKWQTCIPRWGGALLLVIYAAYLSYRLITY